MASTTTDGSGIYTFTGVAPGSGYTVVFDTTGLGGKVLVPLAPAPFSLTAGQVDLSRDAAIQPAPVQPATVGDLAFNDANSNGVQDAGEGGFAGLVVTLYQNGSAVASTTTNASGAYSFTGVTPGSGYTVVFDTTGLGGKVLVPLAPAPFSLTAGQVDLTHDVAVQPAPVQPATVGDLAFNDANSNGVQDPGEGGFAGLVVTLYQNGSAVASTTTNASGAYSFTGVTPGSGYTVVFDTTGLGAQGKVLVPLAPAPFSLTAGQVDLSRDVAVQPAPVVPPAPATVGDLAFNDTNSNGVQDPGEGGFAGLVVTLYQNGSAVASTTTNTSGAYSFTGVAPGSGYTVVFDTTGLGGKVLVPLAPAPFSLTAGQVDLTHDVAVQPAPVVPPAPATVGDLAFNDTNNNGVQDPGEGGFAGLVVTLYQNGSAVASTTTNASGAYSFTGVAPGSGYTVVFDTTGLGGKVLVPLAPAPFSLTAGQVDLTHDVAVQPAPVVPPAPATVGDLAFNDANNNGVQDPGEGGFAGLVVTLYQNGSVVASTTTNASGAYSFTGVAPGSGYTVVFDTTGLGGKVLVPLAPAPFSLTAGQVDLTHDVAVQPAPVQPATVGDLAFNDANNNGVQDPGEGGFAGLVVTLYQNGTLVASTTTNASGAYSFTGVAPGSGYTVVFDTTGLGAQGKVLVPLAPAPFSLTAGQVDLTHDVAVQPKPVVPPAPATVGDLAFNDTNSNGVQDPGEGGFAGLVVTLYQNGSAVASTTTNASGAYSFTGVAPGSGYTVVFDTTGLGGKVLVPLAPAPFSLTAGQVDLTHDVAVQPAPEAPKASVGDFVFLDKNGNGIQDSDEPGVSGITVSLFQNTTAGPVQLASMVTPESGLYSFTGLTPGSGYFVKFDTVGTAARQLMITRPGAGTNTAFDSNAGPGGVTAPFSLSAGEVNNTIDAGFEPYRFDLALSKQLASTGPFMPGDTIRYVLTVVNNGNRQAYAVAVEDRAPAGLLLQPGDSFSAITNNTASALIQGPISPGEAVSLTAVSVIDPAFEGVSIRNVGEITQADDNQDPLDSPPVDDNSTPDNGVPTEDDQSLADLPIGETGIIGDLVFNDTNNNGTRDPGETGVPNIPVTLYQNGNVVSTTITDGAGMYVFTGVVPGSDYTVVFDTTGLGAQGQTLIALAPAPFSLTAGQVDLTRDAAIQGQPVVAPTPATVGDLAFNDTNSNGVQDPGESGFTGLVVTLYQNGNAVASTTTDASGNYTFMGVPPGSGYTVVFDTTGLGAQGQTLVALAPAPFSLTAGQVDLTHDAAIQSKPVVPATVGDLAFSDPNKNGVQDAGETGYAGLVVTLFQNGSAVATTTTDASGVYSFTGVVPGSGYTVVFDTTGLGAQGQTLVALAPAPFSLTAGQVDLSHDAAVQPKPVQPATVGDLAFSDPNKNGVQDAGEPGVPNVLVTLYQNGSAVASTTTDGSGIYTFTGVAPGSGYTVVFDTTGLGGKVLVPLAPAPFSLTAGQVDLSRDAAIQPKPVQPATVGDLAFNDANSNGVQDPGEPGVPNVLVTLYQNGSAVASTTTNASGAYSFTGVAPGSGYTVVFDTTGLGAQGKVLVPLAPAPFSLTAGQVDLTRDAAIQPKPVQPATVGDLAFNDANSNGVQDPGEGGFAGLPVKLFQNGTLVASTTTNASGAYSFTGVAPGSGYTVVFDTTGLGGKVLVPLAPAPFSLTAGQVDLTRDAAIQPAPVQPATVGDLAFNDTNNNGVQDPGEGGFTGLPVKLFQNGTLVASTTTNASGAYSFTGVTPGSGYTVVFDTTGLGGKVLVPLAPAPFSLTAGQVDLTRDAAIQPKPVQPATVGDLAFNDTNSNGVQDPGEGGFAGLPVKLFQNGTLVASTTTNASGAYSFTGVAPGSGYTVVFDTTGLGGKVLVPLAPAPFSLTAGQVDLTRDAAVQPKPVVPPAPATVGDLAFNDTNNNGVQDPGEGGFAGLPVKLFQNGTLVASTTTNASGAYSFTGVTPGSGYTVVFDTTGLGGKVLVPLAPAPFSLTAGQVDLTHDVAVQPKPVVPPAPATVGDLAFNDANSNGVQDPGEGGFAGLPVKLFQNGTLVASTTTNASGAYSFTGVTPGSGYTVVFDTTGLGGKVLVPLAPAPFSLTAGQVDLTRDAAIQPAPVQPATVGDLAFNDTNNNGVQDPGEGGFAGLVVTLYQNGSAVASTTTNASGAYSFTGVAPGSGYTVVFDTTGLGGKVLVPLAPAPFSLTAGQVDLTHDVAVQPAPVQPATVGDLAFNDANNNGVQDPGEGGFAGLVVTLYQNGTLVASTTTNASGAYSFTGVTPGSGYTVVFDTTGLGGKVLVPLAPAPFSLTAGQVDLTHDVAVQPKPVVPPAPATVGDLAFNDANSNGVQDAGEGGFAGLVVKLFQNGTLVASTTTNASGAYSFTGVTPGSGYTVVFDTTGLGGKVLVPLAPAPFSLTAGQVDLTHDAAVQPKPVQPVQLADLAIAKAVTTAGPYAVGQTVSYSITVTNNGPVTARNVTVKEQLGAGLTYVSANPAGEYNSGNSTWTVGDLAAGARRTLTLQTTVGSAGTLRNTVVLASPDNDPSRAANDTARVDISAGACVAEAPYITCAITDICKGDVTLLQSTGCANGTIRWSDGQTGVSIQVQPALTTIYTATCVVSANCVSVASNQLKITVRDPQTPTLVASADNVCPGGQVTLTASGCTGGTYLWSASRETTASIVVSPTVRTTYTVQCRLVNCVSPAAAKTIGIGGTSLPKPTVTCSTTVVCPGETVTLTVNGCQGTPVWSSTSESSQRIVVTPTAESNSYTVYCRNGACVSPVSDAYTIKVVTPVAPTLTASADSVCAGTKVTLTASGCVGTVIWSNQQQGNSITVTPDANISYFAQCKFRECLSDRSEALPITIVTPSAPIVKADKLLLCSGERLTLSAEGCTGGTVKWYGADVFGSTVTILPTETKEYYATCRQGSCESTASNKVRVTVNSTAGAAPQISASNTTVCNGGVISLTATGCSGTVLWSDGQTGSVVSVTATTNNSSFYAVCKVGATCASGRSNVINATVTPAPTPTITCSTTISCPSERVTLTINNCIGTPRWSTGETTTRITVMPTVTTSYNAYCEDGVCRSPQSKDYTIKVVEAAVPTVTASASTVAPGGTVTLTATGCAGDVIWSVNGIDGSNKGSSIVVRPEGKQTYYAQCKFRECLSDPSEPVTINRGDCLANAGTLVPKSPVLCANAGQTVLVANVNGGLVRPEGYVAVYVLTKGSNKVVEQTSATSSFTVTAAAGTYTIHTLVYDARQSSKDYFDISLVKPGLTTATDVLRLITDRQICADLDVAGASMRVNKVDAPTISASSSLTTCFGSAITLNAAGCAGGTITWSDGSTGASITKTVTSNLQLSATCSVDGCVSAASTPVNIVLGTAGVPTIASTSATICAGESVTLTASGCAGGTLSWSDNKTTGSTLIVAPTASTSYRVKCTIGNCESDFSAATPVTVGSPAAPTVAGNGSATPTVCAGTPVTLLAQGCAGTVTWSTGQTGASITVTPAANASYTARCSTSATCQSPASTPVMVTVLAKPATPRVADKSNVCPAVTVDLTAAVLGTASTTGGVFEYYTNETLSAASKVADPGAVGTGTYYVVEKATGGCYSQAAPVRVLITTCGTQVACDPANPVTVSAGPDASICAAKTYQLQGKLGGSGTKLYWTTSGNGTFDNPFAANAIYTASAEDILSGKVTLTVSASASNASCPVATDAMVLTISGGKTTPIVQVSGSTSLCAGETVTLQAPAGAASYRWSNNATTSSIVVTTSGEYTVQLFDASGCSTVPSAPVVVRVAAPVATPVVSNLRNTCPAVVANLTTAVSVTTAGNSYEYRIGQAATSAQILRPDSVGAGTYYVFQRNSSGCVSAPAKVVVSIFECRTDTLTADLALVKTADKSQVKQGETVIYTLSVTNNGPGVARRIDLRDVLPAGVVSLTTTPAAYTVSNGVVTARIDSLNAGATRAIQIPVTVTGKGAIVNKGEIIYADQRDPNPANNVSTVTITDTTSSGAPGRIGLAKSVVGVPVCEGDSILKVRYRFVATNYGGDTLRNVQITDDLAYAFSPAKVQSARFSTTDTDFTLVYKPSYTGTGDFSAIFDSASYIKPGASQIFFLDVTVKRAKGDTTHTYRNIASATAKSQGKTIDDLSIDGINPDPDADGNPNNNTGFTVFTIDTTKLDAPRIGVAKAVADVVKVGEGSFNVRYKATVKNLSTVPLYAVSLIDSLAPVFTAPATFSVVEAPSVRSGSTLIANAAYDGTTRPNLLNPTSLLNAGEEDTLTFVVNVTTNGDNGPFLNSILATAMTGDSAVMVRDTSNNGIDPTRAGFSPTPVRFDLPGALLGIAKAVGVPTEVESGVYDIPYTIRVTNRSLVPIRRVQVQDNLSETFSHGALIVSNQIVVDADSGLTANPNYTGQGLITNLLVDSLSSLPAGATRAIRFTVRVDVRNADSTTFFNSAIATALSADNIALADTSMAGTDDDPDNDLDPRDNNVATPVSLTNAAGAGPRIGVALAVSDTVRLSDGSFNVTYKVVVRNFGRELLRNVALNDTLTKVFNTLTGATYTVVRPPVAISTGSTLKLNTAFDGDASPWLVLGDSTSTLPGGQTDTLQFVINVSTNGSTTTYLNTVYASASAVSGRVTDTSTNGLQPDLNGNGNPSDSNESEPTPLVLPPTNTTIFIPEGFSPNGDGVNDLFVIRGVAGLRVSLEIYNRWGHMVYKNDDYRNDWDGTANTGILVDGEKGLPDGAYYYVVRTSDGRQFVRYMTINR
ncbi:hypothetical protein GCM10027578_07670 [Spirosoma luteolum]